ncbi:hypothetical protein GUJ93_ZPchr0009g890 [Zizania palustris]|uniref:Uncharacterized protein n=1 Tax=Zizania palustris TaxID=103762 RepID=A0A8J5S3B0_ZIZPA|nr:hypothetical protein GUJ93_ZPchr0009g890 [Zizania palustris]
MSRIQSVGFGMVKSRMTNGTVKSMELAARMLVGRAGEVAVGRMEAASSRVEEAPRRCGGDGRMEAAAWRRQGMKDD